MFAPPCLSSFYAPHGRGATLIFTMNGNNMPPNGSGIHDDAIAEQTAAGLTLPKWFLITITGIAGVFAVTYVPWSVWVTWTLIDFVNVKETRGEVLLDHRARLIALEVSRENHALQLQAISSTRFTAEQANALNQGTLAEIRAVASDVKSLQRDFDRSGIGKAKPTSEIEQ